MNQTLLDFVKRELALSNFDKTDLGDTILKFIEQSAKLTNNDTRVMRELASMLVNLIDQKLIAPITEDDFVEETHEQGSNKVTIWRCTRNPYVYKTEDGEYWDDRAVAFRYRDSPETDQMYLYQSEYNSKKSVSLPYFPVCETRIINRN